MTRKHDCRVPAGVITEIHIACVAFALLPTVSFCPQFQFVRQMEECRFGGFRVDVPHAEVADLLARECFLNRHGERSVFVFFVGSIVCSWQSELFAKDLILLEHSGNASPC